MNNYLSQGFLMVGSADLRIVPYGSGGAIWYLDWFLNYCDIKLARQASEIQRNDDLLAYCKHLCSFSF